MTAYYNDNDKQVCAWLRELIKAGVIADGEVDDRSILDVEATDLAGIGGWSYALRLAGWPDERPVWTGSPPCQPFSVAGRREGRDDARHLAPHFVDLVRACRPGVLFGEQVASAEVFGKTAKPSRRNAAEPPQWAWIDDLSDRLEAARYAVGASDFPSAGVGAPHIRQRTFFGAYDLEFAAGWLSQPNSRKRDGVTKHGEHECDGAARGRIQGDGEFAGDSGTRGVADEPRSGRREEHADARGRGLGDCAQGRAAGPDAGGASGGMGDSFGSGLEGLGWNGDGSREPGRIVSGALGSASEAGATCRLDNADTPRGAAWLPAAARGYQGDAEVADDRMRGLTGCDEGRPVSDGPDRPGPTNGFWGSADWLACRDGKWRPVEPGLEPLAHGLPARVGRLRGYGNAINPHAAAQFVTAFMESIT